MRRAHGREWALLEVPVRPEALAFELDPGAHVYERAFADLALAQLQAEVLLHDLEGDPRRGEEELVPAGADPERPPCAARGSTA